MRASKRFLAVWLDDLFLERRLDRTVYAEGRSTFGLNAEAGDWVGFARWFCLLFASLACVTGLILFFAWNWHALPRWGRFALAQCIFVLCAVGIVLVERRNGTMALGRAAVLWPALGLCAGALLALYGQTYQTGAHSWELFRAWTLCLVLFALLSRSTGLALMGVVTTMIWVALYTGGWASLWMSLLSGEASWRTAVLIWIVFETLFAVQLKGRAPFHLAPWVVRVVGGFAIALIVWRMGDFIWNCRQQVSYEFGNPEHCYALPASQIFVAQIVLLAAAFAYYLRFRPSAFYTSLVSLCVLFLAAWAILLHVVIPMTGYQELAALLLLGGCIVIVACIAAAKITLWCRNRVAMRLSTNIEVESLPAYAALKTQDAGAPELRFLDWLCRHNVMEQANVPRFLTRKQLFTRQEQPWYVKVPLVLGLWIGALLVGAGLLSAGLTGDDALMGVAVALYGGALALMRSSHFAGRQAGLCALALSVVLCTAALRDVSPTVLAYFLGCMGAWLAMPSETGKAAAFTCGLTCLTVFLQGNGVYDVFWDAHESYFSMPARILFVAALGAGTALSVVLTAGALGLHGGKYAVALVRSASGGAVAYAALVTLINVYVPEHLGGGLPFPQSMHPMGFALAGLALAVFGLAVRKHGFFQHHARLSLVAAPICFALAAVAATVPIVAMGATVLLLTRLARRPVLSAFGAAYLVFGIVQYYATLQWTLLYKAAMMFATGMLFFMLALLVTRIWKRSAAAGVAAHETEPEGGVDPEVRCRPRAMRVCQWACIIVFGSFLLLYNTSILEKEALLRAGKRVVLELLHPVDPRSLMQGDYVELNLQVGSAIAINFGTEPTPNTVVDAWWSRLLGVYWCDGVPSVDRFGYAGAALLRIDERGVGTLASLLPDGQTCSDSEARDSQLDGLVCVNYEFRGGYAHISSESFFVEEGAGLFYEQEAQFVEMRIGPDGTALMTQLLDGTLKSLQPEAPQRP